MYLAVLGREPALSNAELEALFGEVDNISHNLSSFDAPNPPEIDRLGGTLKLARKIEEKPLDFLAKLPEGKITLGISDYSKKASAKSAREEAMKLKKILTRHQRSVRIVLGDTAVLSTATSLHNGLSGKNPKKCELIKVENDWYKVIGVQDIDAYARRDQGRPRRDAKVGMLPPKLAQILINLCGPLKPGSVILDPFCGTGVVLQEAILMGYSAYGTDLSERMVEYSKVNLEWLVRGNPERGSARTSAGRPWQTAPWDADDPEGRRAGRTRPENQLFQVHPGNAIDHKWSKIDAIACEGYLGKPMNKIPSEMELKEQKQETKAIILGFLKNLAPQISKNTPVTIAVPAWLRENGHYERLEIIDEIENMGYNVENKTREGLLYHREGQIVARDIIILRKN